MSQSSPNKRFTSVCIDGMTCPSCELLLERKLKAVPGVTHVDVDHRTGIARITADANNLPDGDRIESVIEAAGYSVVDGNGSVPLPLSPDARKWMEIGAALVVIFAGYMLLKEFDLVSLAPSTSGVLSLGGVLLIGLVAGTSSCLAVTGGLLLALAAKHNELHQSETPWEKFRPLLHFNVGRLASYFVLGGLAAVIGQSITLSTRMTGYANIAVALIMLYLALSILDIVPKGKFPIKPPKKLSRWIASLSESDHPAAPFTLGAFTFFLPCGFTQSLQLAALASGTFMAGAMIMFVFALGTLPSLIGISAVSSTASGNFSRMFLRFSGVFVFVLALFNLNSGFALAGIDLTSGFAGAQRGNVPAAAINANVQEVSMAVTRYGYEPSNITIKAGVPVRWTVNGDEASGCTSVLTIPSLDISQPLRRGDNVIEFTPTQKGQLAFMCSMGMVRGSFRVI